MGVVRRQALRDPSALLLLGALVALAVAAASGVQTQAVALGAATLGVLAAGHRVLLGWRALLATTLLVVLFVPIKRYQLPANLPFDLELYRIVVAFVLAGWLASLLVDEHVRLRPSPAGQPLKLFGLAVVASVLVNPGRVADVGSEVPKSLSFLLSFLLIYYFTISVVRDAKTVALVVRVLVGGLAVCAGFALVERRTGYNVFYHLQTVIPFLEFQGATIEERAGRLRVFGSSQHPIALGAAFAIAVPLAIALAQGRRRAFWLGVTGLLLLGALATTSRTAVVMLLVSGLMLLSLRPAAVKRLLPLAIPALVVAYVITPGAVGSIRDSFFPAGGLVAQQTRLAANADPLLAGGRLRLIGPSLHEWAQSPILGNGWGTRLTGFDNPLRNAPILDNQWLGLLLELGLVGVAALLWLIVRTVRLLTRMSRGSPESEAGWLAAGLAASLASLAVGMLTFDTFSFIQITFLFWILLGLGAALVVTGSPDGAAALAARWRERPAASL